MAVKTNAQLAAYFNTGDQPSESNFGDLIDTVQPSHVLLGDEDVSLTAATHGFRTLIMPALGSADRTITLPTSFSADSVWFHIIYFGELDAADDYDLLIKTGTQNTHFFHGCVMHHDTDADSSGAALNVPVFGDGDSNDVFNLQLGAYANVWIHAKSTTAWYIWGNTAGATTLTIGDS